MLEVFKRKAPAKPTAAPVVKRSYKGAQFTRFSGFLANALKPNQQLALDGMRLVERARALAQNSDQVNSFLLLMQRNIIGESGFRLQCRARKDGGTDAAVNDRIEELWSEYQSATGGFVTLEGTTGGREFDSLVLRTLLVDGEVFLRKHEDPASPFGVRYELIDSLDVDYQYNEALVGNRRVRCGIKLDKEWRPVSYFIRENENDMTENTGRRIEVPASEIIHIYRKLFAKQVRGVTPLAAAIVSLAQADSYKEAELVAARMQACNMAMYVKNGSGSTDWDDEKVDKSGAWLSEMEPGIITFAPDGYDVKQLANNHPNNNFGGFVKNIFRGVFASLGISYNKGASDYEAVNYSSLREAALEDRSQWREWQAFIIDEWKDRQYREFLRGVLLSGQSGLSPLGLDEYRRHKFFGRVWDWVDPAKDIAAIDFAIQQGLTDHITEIEKRGGDVGEILDREARYLRMRAERGLPVIAPTSNLEQSAPTEESNSEDTNG